MLSKIFSGKELEKLQIEKFKIPSPKEIELVLEEKKQEARRKEIIESNKNDPGKAAKKDANRILIEVQEKLKEVEVEACLLKIQMGKENGDGESECQNRNSNITPCTIRLTIKK